MAAEALSPDILFSSASDVIEFLWGVDGDAVVVGNVSPADFRALEQERDARRPHARLFYFDAAECVVITVPTAEHEVLHEQLYSILVVQTYQMDQDFSLRPTAGTTYRGPNGVSSGEGDSGGFPRRLEGQDNWPTIVFEAGYSQTMASLHAKMRWWFSASGHRVKVVVIGKMFAAGKRILVEKWQERPAAAPRSGATTTRSSALADPAWAGPMPFAQATHAERSNRALYHVTGGPLTIDYAAVFLRNPTGAQHDFVITDEQLQMTAVSVWLGL